jgi:hypothetical protein
MMKRALLAAFLLAGCGDATSVTSVKMTMDASSGLEASQVGSVEILVIDGPTATCMRVLQPHSPLDDPELEIVAHALFTLDGTAKHLAGIPADRHLVFYAEAFQSPDGARPRIGRGCSEGQLAAGSSAAVSIVLTAASDD